MLVYLGVLLALGSTYYIFKSCSKFVLFNIFLLNAKIPKHSTIPDAVLWWIPL